MLSIQKSILFLALVSVVQVSAAQTSGSEDIRPADEQAIFQMTPADVLRLRGAAANHEQAQYREIINPEITAQLVEINLPRNFVTCDNTWSVPMKQFLHLRTCQFIRRRSFKRISHSSLFQ